MRARDAHPRRPSALFVDPDEAAVVRGDLRDRSGPVEAFGVGGVCLHRLAEDRASDREADVAADSRAGAEPPIDEVIGRAAAEDDARDVVASLAAHELRDLVAG